MIRTDHDGTEPTRPSTGEPMVLIDEPQRLTDAVAGNFGPALDQLAERSMSQCRLERDRLEERHLQSAVELAEIEGGLANAKARVRALSPIAADERAAMRRPTGPSLIDRFRSRSRDEVEDPSSSGTRAALEQARSEIPALQAAACLKRAEIEAHPVRAAAELESFKDALLDAFEREGNAMLDRRAEAHGGQILDSWLEEWTSHPRPDFEGIVLRLSTSADASNNP